MTDRLELISRMIDGTCAPHEYDESALKAERERLLRRNGFTRQRIVDTMPGGPDRVRAIDARLAEGHPGKTETAYARRARESIEREDVAAFDLENAEPPSDLQTALAARERALEKMDRAIDALATARAAELEALAVILTHAPGKETREFLHAGHVSAALLARRGDAGFVDDTRMDKSAPSPRLSALAVVHRHIRKPEPVIRKPTKSKRAA